MSSFGDDQAAPGFEQIVANEFERLFIDGSELDTEAVINWLQTDILAVTEPYTRQAFYDVDGVAEEMAQSGDPALVERAKQMIVQVENPVLRAHSLSKLIRLGDSSSISLAREAANASGEEGHPDEKAWILAQTVKDAIDIGEVDMAINIACELEQYQRSLSRWDFRGYGQRDHYATEVRILKLYGGTVAEVAAALAERGEFEGTIAWLNRLDAPNNQRDLDWLREARQQAKAALIRPFARAGLLDQARQLREESADDYHRGSRSLLAIVAGTAEGGAWDEALEMYEQWKAYYDTNPSADFSDAVGFAQTAVDRGEYDLAVEVMDRISWPKTDMQPFRFLRNLAAVYPEAGAKAAEVAVARDKLGHSLEKTTDNLTEMGQALPELIVELYASGQREVALTMINSVEFSDTAIEAACKLAALGDNEALGVAAARIIASGYESYFPKLIKVATEQGDSKLAKELLGHVGDTYYRIQALTILIGARVPGMRTYSREVKELIGTLEDKQTAIGSFSAASRQIAAWVGLATNGKYVTAFTRARRFASSLGDPKQKLNIFQDLAEAGDEEAARLRDELLPGVDDRSWRFYFYLNLYRQGDRSAIIGARQSALEEPVPMRVRHLVHLRKVVIETETKPEE